MVARRASRRTYFGEFFERAALHGIDETEAASALRDAVVQGIPSFGYRRRYEMGMNDRKEALPRDIDPQRVPLDLWCDVERPDATLVSKWFDDPEKVGQWIKIDWLSGELSTGVWIFDPMEFVMRDYNCLHLHEKDASRILKDLSGLEPKRRGAQPGPRDPWERGQVAKGLEMIGQGDERRHAVIAAELSDKNLSADEFERQKRRISAGLHNGSLASE